MTALGHFFTKYVLNEFVGRLNKLDNTIFYIQLYDALNHSSYLIIYIICIISLIVQVYYELLSFWFFITILK